MIMFSSVEIFLVTLVVCITLMSIVGFMRISSLSKNKKNLPPSPPKLPIIGNFHQLGTIPRLSFRNLSYKYGPLMLLHIGKIPTLVVSSAIIAREIMKTHDLAFADRPSLTIPNILFYNSRDIAFSRYGENWRKLKSIVVLHLLSGTRVKSFQRVREEEMSVMIGAIAQSHGTLVDLSALLERLTSNVLCRVAFGRTYQGVGIINKIKECVDMLGTFCVGNYISWLSWIDRLSGVEPRARKLSIEIDNFLKGVVEEHLSKKTLEDVQGESAQNFVNILCDIQEDNTNGFILHTTTLKAVLLDVLVAGFDTTFITLEWAISELIRHPNVMKELQQEMAGIAQGRSTISEEDVDKLKCLKAVIKETLRLHPPLPLLVSRESRQEVNLMGYVIPPGTQVVINAWAIGRDPMSWTQSDEFKPERFLNNSIDYKGLNFEFLPFGSGRRGCPGIHFAVSVVELALANIVHKFDFALPNGANAMDLDMSEENGITLKRKSPLLVIASPRF